MTSIGTVFVNVQPDTSGFAERLRAGLSRISTEDIKVKATPDTGGFVERLRADLARVRAEDIKVKAVPDTTGFVQRLRADLARAAAEDIKVKAVPDTAGFTQRLRADLARASAESIKVKAEPDTSGFTQRLRADLAHAAADSIKVKVEPDVSGFSQRLRARMATLGADDFKIPVQPDFTGFRDAVRLELAWIRANMRLDIKVTADSSGLRRDVADAIRLAQLGQRINIPINAQGRIGGLGGILGAGGGGAAGAGGGITGSLGGLMGIPIAGMVPAYAAAAVAATALAGSVTALASALAPAAVLMGSTMPAAALAMGQATAAVAIPMAGVTSAMKAASAAQKDLATTGKVTATHQAELKDAMSKLAPAAQQFVGIVTSLRPAWENLQKATQQALFPGVNDGLRQIIKTLPTLQGILVQTSRVMGDLARQFGQMFASPLWQRDIQTVGRANAEAIRMMGGAGLNVLDIFRNLTTAAVPFALRVVGAVQHLTDAWRSQIEVARQSGALNALFQKGSDVIFELGRIAGATFSGLWHILQVGYPYGKQILDMIEGWAKKFQVWVKAAENQQKINDFFKAAVLVFEVAAKAVGALVVALTAAVSWIGHFASQLNERFGTQIAGFFRTAEYGVVALFAAMKNGDVTSDGFVGAMERIGVGLRNAAPFFLEVGRTIGDFLVTNLRQAWATFQQLLPILVDVARFIGQTILPVLLAFKESWGAISPVLTALRTTLNQYIFPALAQVANTLTTQVIPAISSLLKTAGSAVADVLPVLGKLLRDNIAPALDEVGKVIHDVIGPAVGALLKFLSTEVVPFFAKILGPIIDGIKTYLHNLRDAINDNKGHFQDFYKAIKPLVDFLRDYVAPIVGFIAKTSLVMLSVQLRVMTTILGIAAEAIARVIGFFKGLAGGIASAAGAIGDFFSKLPGRITGFLGDAGRWLLNAGKTIIDGLVSGITTAANAVWDFFKRLPDRIFGAIGFAAGWLIKTGMDIVHGLTNGLSNAGNGIADFFTRLPGRIVGFFSDAKRWLLETGVRIVSGLVDGFNTAVGAVSDFFRRLPSRITGFFGDAGRWLLETGAHILGGLVNGLSGAVSSVVGFFTRLPGRITGAIGAAGRWLLQTGKDIISGLFTGITDAIKAVGTWIYDHIFKPFINGFKHAFGIDSPAKAMLSIGRDIIAGLLNGILDAIKAVGTWLFQHVALPILNAFKTAGTWLINAGKSILGGLLSGLGAIGNIAAWIWQHIALPIAGAFGTAGSWLLNAGKSVLRGLLNGLGAVESVMAGAGRWIYDHIGRPILGAFGNVGGWLLEAGKNILRSLMRGLGAVESVMGGAGRWIYDNVGKPILGAFSDVGGWLYNKGKDILHGLTNGIKDAAQGAGGVLGDAGNWIKDHILAPFNPFGSPSRPMIAYGRGITDGLTAGIQQGRAGAGLAGTNIANAVVGPINTIPTAATSAATRTNIQLGGISAGMGSLAANTATRTGQIVGSTNNMAGGIGAAVGRVVTSLTTQDRRTDTTQANHATRMGQIRGQADAMERGIGAAVGRFVADMIRQDTKTNQTQANHNTRMGQIREQADAMQRGIGNTVNQFIGHMIREDNKTNQTQANHNTRMGQIRGQADAMQRGIGATVTRFIGNLQSQDNQTNRTQANHGTRMGQINTASTRMADNTGTQTGRVNRSYQGMQRQVDSLHGKDFNVRSHAAVILPAAQAIVRDVNNIAGAVRKLIGFRDGGILMTRYADGGLNGRDLPNQALIAPTRGRGLVQWAEPETGGEAFIPLAASKRERSLQIWRETGRLLGAFAIGGWVNPTTSLDEGTWQRDFQTFIRAAESSVQQIGQAAGDTLAKMTGNMTSAKVAQSLAYFAQSLLAPHGPGFSISGSWAAGIRPWVEYIARSMNISAMTYSGHHPAQSHAADLALGQAGMVNTAPATGPSGNDLYSAVARWIDSNILAKNTPGWYVGTHAAIHTRGGAWHPASSQVGRRGQTYAHDDHVHVSFDPRYDGAPFGIPSNYSAPGFSWNEGAGPPAVSPIAAAANIVSNAFISGGGFTQPQMEAAMRAAGADPNLAHIFSAIGMAENPASRPVLNQYGWFDSVWAIMRSYSQSKGYDINRLNSDINYAAQAALALYRTSGFGPWEAYTGGTYRKFLAEGGILDRLGRMFMADGGFIDLLRRRRRKKTLEPGDEDWGVNQAAIRGVRGHPARQTTFDRGGWLEPGVTVASNRTGRAERVIAPHTEDKTVALLTQLVAIMAEQNRLLRTMPNAQADALNSVAYRAMTYR